MFELISNPESIVASEPTCLKIRYVHQGPPLGKGASIRLGYNTTDGAGVSQTDDSRKPNYLRIESSCQAKLEIAVMGGLRSITYFPGVGMCDLHVFEINVVDGTLNSSESFDIVLGTKEIGGFIVGKGCDSPWEIFFHVDDSGKYQLKGLNPAYPDYREYLTADGKDFPSWKSCGIKIQITPQRAEYVDISLV